MLRKEVRSLLLLLVLLLCVGWIVPTKVKAEENEGISRAEWLHNLVNVFSIEVDVSDYPDNYYPDVTVKTAYYADIMKAVAYGLVDIEAGSDFEPDRKITRDFAADTLNQYLKYQLEKGETYTFSDVESCQHPDSDQVAINQGWFQLDNGIFHPDAVVTPEEAETILANSEKIIQSEEVSETHDNVFDFADDVIAVPEGTEVSADENNTITIVSCPVNIKVGDKFGVFINGIASVYQAVKVSVSGDITTIETTIEDIGDDFDKVDAEGVIPSGDFEIIPEEGVIVDVEEEIVPSGSKVNGNGKSRAVKKIKNINARIPLSVSGHTIVLRTSLTNAKVEYIINNNQIKAVLKGVSTTSLDGKINLAGLLLDKSSIPLYTMEIPGIGGVTINAYVTADMQANIDYKCNLSIGFTVTKSSGMRLIYNSSAKSFHSSTEVSASAGIKAKLGIYNMRLVSAYIDGDVGIKAILSSHNYGDGNLPKNCTDFFAYLYASTGAHCNINVKAAGWKKTVYDQSTVYFNQKNSPIKIHKHYEDRKAVIPCTRGGTYGYYTGGSSKYWGSGWSGGDGAYGLDANGNPVLLFEYTLKTVAGEEVATITKYNGNASYVNIPEEIDGYRVVALGDGSFMKKSMVSVNIPDGVTTIGSNAFASCSSLSNVKLSKSLTTLEEKVFYNDDDITEIEIPKSLVSGGDGGWEDSHGAFHSCSGLKKVRFEEGTTRIAKFLFAHCDGLEEISIPETVTVVEVCSFMSCANLQTVNFGEAITKIEDKAFGNCTRLKSAIIPDGVTTIGSNAFASCSSLSNVKLSKSLTTLEEKVFYNDDGITEIEIPKSLVSGGDGGWEDSHGAFHSCSGLKRVRFEEGTTRIAKFLFAHCDGLEEISIPETVTAVDDCSFMSCTNLQTVNFGEAITKIGYKTFRNCTHLKSANIPNSVTIIASSAFESCSSLESAILPKNLKTIEDYTFQNSGLKSISIPESITKIGKYAFAGSSALKSVSMSNAKLSIEEYAFNNCDSLSEIVFGENITSIGLKAFYDCDELVTITIPDSVSSLGNYTFAECELLSNVTLGTGITKIPSYIFNQCPALKKITLPYRVTSIMDHAFANCTSFTEITIPRSVTSIDATVFSYPDKLTIYGVSGTYAEEFATANSIKFVPIDKPATEISLSQTEVTLSKGKTAKIALSISPVDFTDEVSWKSSDTSIVTIDSTGLITAKGVGNATIKVTVGSMSKTCKVTVLQPITGIYLNANSKTLNALDTFQITARISPDNAYVKEVKWESSAPDIASVDQNGLVTAHKKGTAQIKIIAYYYDGGWQNTCDVTVTNNATIAESVSEMESPHNYSNKCTDYWVYTLDGAQNIDVTFDERTEIEDGFDYLYIFDKNKNQIGKYTGKALSGKTVTISGNVVIIQIVSDDSGNEWGFKVTEVRESEGPPPDPEEDQKAADAVANQIRNMDTTDPASVEAARQAYEDLTPEQKELIDSSVLKKLTDAETAIEEAKEKEKQDLEAAQAVMDIINQLDVNDPDSVEAARAAYNALNPDQKKLIDTSTLKILTDAEKEIAEAEKAKEDQEAAQSAINVINQIDVNDPSSIEAARKAYNALTADQKKLIDASVLKTLKDAEETIKQERSIILVTSIKLTGLSKMIAAGKKLTLKATVLPTTATNKKLKWTSSNTNLAKVTQSGVITINKNAGGKTVTIKATATDGSKKTITWNIKVMKGAVKKITVKGYKKTLKAGKTMKLKAVVKVTKGKPVNKKLKWTSSNKKWATVTQNGKVKALKNGKGKTVKITVESTDGTNKKVVKKIKIK